MTRKQQIRRAVVVVTGGALLVWGVCAWLHARSHESTDDAQIEAHVVPIIPKVGGYIDSVYVTDNQPVKAGDTLFTIEASDYRVRLERARAEERSARAASRRGAAGAAVLVATAQAQAARANIDAATAAYVKAKSDLARFRTLADQDVASRAQLESAEAAFRAADAALRAARDQARASASGLRAASANASTADARLAAAQAAVHEAELQLSYTVVTAPMDGRIAKKTAEVGQLVTPGQPLMAVVDGRETWVVANLKETQLGRVQQGQLVEFTVDAYGSREFRGSVESVQDATGARFALLPPDNATGNFTKVVQRVPVKILVDPSSLGGARLRPGMSVEVSIDVGHAPMGARTLARSDR
ncbi:MAG TPA: HlyD family secretion protein [Gemmatimonadaceae bacterium]|nr:HlyD family secretion protein [Gemmatimonadaceae bacterium]